MIDLNFTQILCNFRKLAGEEMLQIVMDSLVQGPEKLLMINHAQQELLNQELLNQENRML